MSSNSMLEPIIRALVGVDSDHHGVILDAVNKLGGQNATTVHSRIAKALREPTAKPAPSYLTHLASVSLAPTKGSATITGAKDVFTGHLDSDFNNWGTNVPGKDTAVQAVSVNEMRKDGTFAQLFNSLGDPRSLCLTQGQIVEFCRTHRNQLRQEGYATLFLFEVKDELFVAYVRVLAGELRARVYRFAYGNVWFAGHRPRLVVQQQ